MFRLSQFLRELDVPSAVAPRRDPKGPVVIWNLVRRCNLLCRHCYSGSTDKDFSGELNTDEIKTVMADLHGFGVPALILSGGEPLLRSDLFEIAAEAKSLGFPSVALSTNGTLVDDAMADRIGGAGFDYVGISVDGIGAVHDTFRGRPGAFAEALGGIRRCVARRVKVGLRFTMTRDNAHHLPDVLYLAREMGVGKFYFSHLNYAGRGNANREEDAHHRMTRRAMDSLFDAASRMPEVEFVTGNNDADGAYFLKWVENRRPERAGHVRAKLAQWGGNASGRNVANIDNLGWVHPDTMWWHERLGNVRQRPFSAIWSDLSNPLMAGLKQFPRRLSGRCGSCAHLALCNGNSRVRAERIHDDRWGEDPGCYLTDAEIAA
ncbi:heme d1 biosynthesis radical SAM protein NirJ [Magnetospirillum aberrantis]|uniref:Pre-heme d1 synthase n=1 Tax=Magnetospirillum aberrantis SpK TaxID=908842 RepID=A0A7C9UUU8_9PROT|nr:heme d1 biosynthesis radical SAM protein NirJ [Magnetospirillum aberrantis]NFV79569.1 heme d1 biosynthesis radical SAM protein NirJ [Magnetospirillum aberrantis SpK]